MKRNFPLLEMLEEQWKIGGFLFAAIQGTVEFETAGGAVEKYSWFHSGGAVILVPMRIWH